MVSCQVRKYRSLKNRPVHPFLRKGMRRHLCDNVTTVLRQHLMQEGLELQRLGGCMYGTVDHVFYHILYCTDETHLLSPFLEYGLYQIAGCSLPVCPCYAYYPQRLRRTFEKIVCRKGKRLPAVLYVDPGHLRSQAVSEILSRPFVNNRSGPALNSLPDKTVAVSMLTRQGEEKIPFLHFPGIIRKSGNINSSVP